MELKGAALDPRSQEGSSPCALQQELIQQWKGNYLKYISGCFAQEGFTPAG